jgi:hypothetical protein
VSVVANGYSGLVYGQSQKTKPRDHKSRWSISLIKATPAKYLGQVFATSEAEAIKEAAKEFNVAEALRDRIVARKENY